MKTEEFIKRVKQLADNVITIRSPFGNLSGVQIYKDDNAMITVWTEVTYAINTVNGNCCVPIEKSYELEELYRLCFEYVATPINER